MPPHHVVVPLPDTILFPGQTMTLRLSPSRITQGLDEAHATGRPVLLLATRQPDAPAHSTNLHDMGVIADIRSLTRDEDGTLHAQLTATGRAEVTSMLPLAYPCARVNLRLEASDAPATGHLPDLQEVARRHARSGSRGALPPSALQLILQASRADAASDLIAQHCVWPLSDKQRVLETLDPAERAELTLQLLHRDLEQHALDLRIAERIRHQQAQQQRDQYLREQLRAVSQELHGEDHDDLEALREHLVRAALPPAARAKADRELARLGRTPATNPEYGVLHTYLEWLADLPWQADYTPPLELTCAAAVLQEAHHGLSSVKERILDYLAVTHLTGDLCLERQTGTSLCLVGPPGVGKTSIAQSVAQALQRPLVRLALGGVRDEAEIRGHRRTYVGAMPGRLLQAIRSAGVPNPVVLLDEIDKLASNGRGDVANALLEVLDPEQNRRFTDHYLEVEYDLSQVVFIATANTLGPLTKPLLDRLEVVPLSGYTPAEKFAIARHHLAPRLLTRHGLGSRLLLDDSALVRLVDGYTREAGVRQLEQQLTQILRKSARAYLHAPWGAVKAVSADDLPAYLGPARFLPESLSEGKAGLSYSLAWSTVGGSLLPVEAALANGRGGLSVTGSVGNVLGEAAHAAVAHLQALGPLYGLTGNPLDTQHLYLHFPDTATPKDGASVGLAVVASLLSALTRRPLPALLAMTGEVTLLGRILPVAGIPEKLIAAQQAGIRHVLLPEGNRPDVAALPAGDYSGLTVTFVADVHDALSHFALKIDGPV